MPDHPRKPSRRTPTAHRVGVLAVTLVSLAACATVAGIDGLQIGACKGGVCAGEGGLDDAPPNEDDTGVPPGEGGTFDGAGLPCPGDKGPVMVRVGTAANNFCIDSTEVTVGHYREFTTATAGDAAGQPAACAWNNSYAAGAGGPTDDLPIAGIDWCDARAYCHWAGKRLCGKQQGNEFAGPVSEADLIDFNTHEWLMACSNVGQLRYPYGGIQQPTACNTGEVDAGRTVAVKSKTACQGGFAGVYDMVGNLWEWIDGPCAPPDAGRDAAGADGGPAKEECVVKGGSYLISGPNLGCSSDGRGASRDRRSLDIGFRCCSD
jgi:formylglycine-generating enzyme required for sulfatase activity